MVPLSTTVPVYDPPPIINAPVELPMLPESVKVFPLGTAKVLLVPAVSVTVPDKVTLFAVPVINKVPPPKVMPPVPLLTLLAEPMDKVPALTVVVPV